MISQPPRILVTNWAHAETLAQLCCDRPCRCQSESHGLVARGAARRAADADAMFAFMPDCIDRLPRACRRLRYRGLRAQGLRQFRCRGLHRRQDLGDDRSGSPYRADRGTRSRPRHRPWPDDPRRRRDRAVRCVRWLAPYSVRHWPRWRHRRLSSAWDRSAAPSSNGWAVSVAGFSASIRTRKCRRASFAANSNPALEESDFIILAAR